MSHQIDTEQATAGVRFSANDDEIAPDTPLEQVETATGKDGLERDDMDEQTREDLRNLKVTLQKSRQQKRMENFAFEPVSLPPSRVASNSSGNVPQQTEKPTPPVSATHTPPLTPAASGEGRRSSEYSRSGTPGGRRSVFDAGPVTPQESPPTGDKVSAAAKARTQSIRPRSADASQPKSGSLASVSDSHSERSGSTATPVAAPPSPRTGTATPVGDANDQSARVKRPSQTKVTDASDARFAYNRGSVQVGTSGTSTPRGSVASMSDASKEDKRRSFFSRQEEILLQAERQDRADKSEKSHSHSSMSELKRFFRLGHKKHKSKSTSRAQSPAPSIRASRSESKTPPATPASSNLPFADDHGLENKYGKFGKVLGSGAGGSVRLMKRSSDGVTFAVKQFRARHSYETEKEYSKKVTAEFCIGSTLHHGNIIETMDIIHEKGAWFEVMEYAPYDLFAIVMTGKMSREEVTCCTLQILAGVAYIHGMGLAHRDLKLDNVVVNEHGIMKIIDFGSAAVFQYPFEDDIVLASGIVGSDPYLAPEVYDLPKYDPRPTDIWSMAIIFCCMTLRRFPWKAPRVSDNSYKLFVAEADDESKRIALGLPKSEPASRATSTGENGNSQHHHHHHRNHTGDDTHTHNSEATTSTQQTSQSSAQIKGPWRLLRLLPRETRHIIGKMLEVDPNKRATMEEVLADKWVVNAQVCRQEQDGKVVRAPGHEHTLEPGSGAAPPPNKK